MNYSPDYRTTFPIQYIKATRTPSGYVVRIGSQIFYFDRGYSIPRYWIIRSSGVSFYKDVPDRLWAGETIYRMET